jgi:hypothetical protein
VHSGNWWFVGGLVAFLAWYIPRSYGTPHHLNGEGNVWYVHSLSLVLMASARTLLTHATHREGLRRSSLYKYTAEYFPLRLARTTPLDSQRKYIFGVHPHGVIPTFVTVSMMSQVCGGAPIGHP